MGRPLRILLFSAAPKADAAGVQAVVLDLARHLRGRGHRVVTAWPDGDGTVEDWRLPLEAGVDPSGRPGPAEMARGVRDGLRLAARLARFRPDVVNLHYPRGQTLYFMGLRQALGYRVVLSFHNSDLVEASDAVLARLPGWLSAAAAVTAVSEDLARATEHHAQGVRVEVIPNGIDTRWWTPGTSAPEPDLAVAAGRLIDMKGFDLLLRAFAAGAPADAALALAGTGERGAALAALARDLGIAHRVRFTGRLDRAGLRDLFRRAGLFVLPSRREGMPLVLLEAMACGCPAVATAVNGVPQIMTTACGEMVATEDPGALAAALAARLGRPDRLRAEAAAARRRAEAFDAEASHAAYEEVFVRVTQGRSARPAAAPTA